MNCHYGERRRQKRGEDQFSADFPKDKPIPQSGAFSNLRRTNLEAEHVGGKKKQLQRKEN